MVENEVRPNTMLIKSTDIKLKSQLTSPKRIKLTRSGLQGIKLNSKSIHMRGSQNVSISRNTDKLVSSPIFMKRGSTQSQTDNFMNTNDKKA